MTLYGADEAPLRCSSNLKIVAEMATCYNSSWIYYSVDGCLQPTSSSIIPPAVSPTSFNGTSSATIPSFPGIRELPIGAIIGCIVGVIAFIALAAGFGLFSWRRRWGRNSKRSPSPSSYELSNEHAMLEAENAGLRAWGEKPVELREMWAHEVAREMARTSRSVSPAELPG